MPDRNTGLRARDADREQVIAALHDALVEGQLSTEDHEHRVGKALSAATIGDLDRLLADLQVPDEAHPQPRRTPWTATRVGVVAVVATGALWLGTWLLDREPDAPPPTGNAAIEDPADRPELAEPVTVHHEPLTSAAIAEFIDVYRSEFGDTDTYDATFYADGRVIFERLYGPVERDLLQDWTWDPERGFNESIVSPSQNVFDYAPVDLADLALTPLMHNLEQASTTLGVESPVMRVDLTNRRGAAAPVVMVRANNSFGESGIRFTTLAGKVTRDEPHRYGGTG